VSDIFGGGSTDYTGENTGTPAMPTFLSDLNPDGSLQSQYSVANNSYMPQEEQQLGNIPQLNGQPLTNLENYATSGSNNPWVQAQQAAQVQQQGQAMGQAGSQAQSSNTAAEDALASHGGLNTGAMENLARNAANNSTMAGQGVIGQGLQQQGQIQTQNAQNELGVSENLPGQEVQALQPALQEQSLWQNAASQNQNAGNQVNEFNTQAALGGLNAQNQFNLTNYQNQVATQAGNEQATAQSNSGKK
jgi:hypothetical protein